MHAFLRVSASETWRARMYRACGGAGERTRRRCLPLASPPPRAPTPSLLARVPRRSSSASSSATASAWPPLRSASPPPRRPRPRTATTRPPCSSATACIAHWVCSPQSCHLALSILAHGSAQSSPRCSPRMPRLWTAPAAATQLQLRRLRRCRDACWQRARCGSLGALPMRLWSLRRRRRRGLAAARRRARRSCTPPWLPSCLTWRRRTRCWRCTPPPRCARCAAPSPPAPAPPRGAPWQPRPTPPPRSRSRPGVSWRSRAASRCSRRCLSRSQWHPCCACAGYSSTCLAGGTWRRTRAPSRTRCPRCGPP
jgi:hypothetical protein